ncbi:BLUF domain-containing protein [Terriglobus sp. TAA 43]|uniref:BLUF domain-containing protein n=1 Tax=Terriglobus sp. TAA 43 TaxID=278961 RepID=UPI000646D869|nr:BLUF domain-containing protein [Terriglobus sp. TAA 43]
MEYRLIYCSRNRIEGSEQQIAEEIEKILVSSRRNNEKHNITGALLFNGLAFAQVLEGPRLAVETLYATICEDNRNSHNVLLETADIAKRDFGRWSMAYSGPDSGGHLYEHLKLADVETDGSGVAKRVLDLLKSVVHAHV